MTEQEKRNELITLIDALCNANFPKQISTLDMWINKLQKIYANGYRHTYSDIFYKVQSIISENSDSEILEILGENLNELEKRLSERLAQNIDDANLQNALVSYKKFSDHIKLEIGRYNFIKNQFNIEIHSKTSNSKSRGIERAEIDDINQKIDKVSAAVDNIRPIATEAKMQMDKIDDKLENNKISSITTLTIFSAVVLAFSGGITFEAGIFKGMAQSSPYRLVFTIALTGFVLFNTVFSLLYLVGKMAGKTISTRCKYMSMNSDFPDATRRCGDGYCQKECNSINLFCRILHKYSYIFVINVILLWVMYADFILWLFKRQPYNFIICAWQILPLIFFAVVALIAHVIIQKYQERKIKFQFKIQLISKIVAPHKETSISYRKGNVMPDVFCSKLPDLPELFLKSIEKIKIVTDKDYKKVLRQLNAFTCQQIIKNNRLCTLISHRQHFQNKKKWKSLKKEFREYLSKLEVKTPIQIG